MLRLITVAVLAVWATGISAAGSGKQCFSSERLSIPGGNSNLKGWRNTGGCSCREAKQLASRPGVFGAYAPQCDADGKFKQEQSWGSTGHSWCADPETGHQLTKATRDEVNCGASQGNSGSGGSGQKDCFTTGRLNFPGAGNDATGWKNTGGCSCTQARQLADKPMTVGNYVPQCDDNGKFRQKQGWGSTGHSWCADPGTGHQVSAAIRGKLTCPDSNDDSGSGGQKECFKMAKLDLPGSSRSSRDFNGWQNSGRCTCTQAVKAASNAFGVGAYVPQCDRSGKFSRQQGWGSTGQSWCVDPATGTQISAFVAPGRGGANC